MNGIRGAVAAVALATLGACDMLGLGGMQAEGNSTSGNSAQADRNEATAAAARNTADAGLTSSRSLSGLTGGGDKDPAAIPAGSGTLLDPQIVIGRWADDELCKQLITIRPDGTFLSYTGGEGTWSINGDVLSLTGSQGTFSVRVQSIENDIMTVVNSDGSIGRSRRC